MSFASPPRSESVATKKAILEKCVFNVYGNLPYLKKEKIAENIEIQ